jgi:hypothetical protein
MNLTPIRRCIVALVRLGLEYASCVWSPHQEVYSARIERMQHNFIRLALRGLGWTTQPLPPYESRCLLLVLEVLSDRRKIAAALFVRDILGSSLPIGILR